MRLNNQLVDQAKQKGRLYKRNARNQIEYWAELGRNIEKHLDPELIIGINEGLLEINIRPVRTSPVSSEDVFKEVARQNKSGELVRKVAEITPVYQASIKTPGALEKRLENGTYQTGKFVDGDFIPLELNSD